MSLRDLIQGLAPYGIRHSGQAAKGNGYYGMLPRPDGNRSSELSAEDTINGRNVEFPLINPALQVRQLKHLLNGGEPTDDIYEIARRYAASRLAQGKSPFIQNGELRATPGMLEYSQ